MAVVLASPQPEQRTGKGSRETITADFRHPEQRISSVAPDEDGVRLPRLLFKDVVVRGAVQGIAVVVLLFVGMALCISRNSRCGWGWEAVGGLSSPDCR
ncbi:DUF6336 family protein [Streptomyces sp. SLBN-118]|uniref:DUF6336 family protein n=1 Tax=Streptomyces sp. SLBN-118 TaxID=2768454 RepID=UPI001C92E5F4